jgi:hypothetical protein
MSGEVPITCAKGFEYSCDEGVEANSRAQRARRKNLPKKKTTQTTDRAWPGNLFVRRISFWKSRMVFFVAPRWICFARPDNEKYRCAAKSNRGRWDTREIAHRIEPLGQAEIADQRFAAPVKQNVSRF